jgi:hypothetical protein
MAMASSLIHLTNLSNHLVDYYHVQKVIKHVVAAVTYDIMSIPNFFNFLEVVFCLEYGSRMWFEKGMNVFWVILGYWCPCADNKRQYHHYSTLQI